MLTTVFFFCKDPLALEILIQPLKQKHPLTDKDIDNDIYDCLGIKVTMKDKTISLLQSR